MQKSLIRSKLLCLALFFFQRSEQNSYCGIILANVDFLSVLRAAWHFTSSKGSEFSYPASFETKGSYKAPTGLWLSESGSTSTSQL